MADLAKAKRLLEKLNAGNDVSLRDVEAALGKDGLAEYEALWLRELESRKYFEVKPAEIIEYEELIHAGDFDENRADGIKTEKWVAGRTTAGRLRERSERKYEHAIERLQEIIGFDDSLRVWFDRELDFDATTTTLGIDRESVPRTVTSRSQHKRSEGAARKRSKAEIKREVFEHAISGMELEQARRNEFEAARDGQEAAMLKQKLAALTAKSKKTGFG